MFCLGDYVCWSAPVDDLGNWRYEGVIYPKTADPLNSDGHMCLYAPDVTVGADGRYYLYYVLDKVSVMSVAVCDTPAGKFEFYGYVHYPDGTRLGERGGDEPQFDPAVLTEGDVTSMYSGFCGQGDSPLGGFEYGGVLVSNTDLHIDSYKPAEMPSVRGANNHGSIVGIGGEWYVFYHRHTNGTWFSRQGCAERLKMRPDGGFEQAEITSCGLNGSPLTGRGEYPAYIACCLFTEEKELYVGDLNAPRIVQDGRDGDEEEGYIANICDGTNIGFRYFDCKGVRRFGISTRGYGNGVFQIKTAWDGGVLGEIAVSNTNVWTSAFAEVSIPDGVNALWLTFKGSGTPQLKSITLG